MSHENVWKDYGYRYTVMPQEGKIKDISRILSLSVAINISVPTRFKKIHTRDNSLEQSSTTKINNDICGYSLYTHCSFDNRKSENDFDRGIDCSKRFRADVKMHTTNNRL